MLALPNNWKNYELLENEVVKGSMQYKNFFVYSAQIHVNGIDSYALKSKRAMFNPRFELTQNQNVVGQMRMNLMWKNDVSITLPDASVYKIVSKGFFSQTYFIENQNTGEQFEIKRKYMWRKLNYAYEFADSKAGHCELLCLMSAYAVNYLDQKMIGLITIPIVLLNLLANNF
ncbi:MAG: hypothetical protein ACK5B6_03990 [Bacteroidia bacterium]|jgi:hypothetical protein